MKKVFQLLTNGIVTAFILLTLFVSCGNLDNEKLASIVISFGNERSEIPYQKSDVSYYIAIITPDPNKEGEVIIDNQKTSHEFAELPSGKYSLNVYAYNEKDILVAEGSNEEIEVNPGETAQAHVTMKLKAYHVHDFAEEWTCDETHHWHAATCEDTDEVQDKAEHNFGEWITVTPATEETEGLRKQTCTICNYEKTEKIPLLNHTHTWATEWTYDKSNHWHECTSASCTERAQVEGHIWDEGIVTTQPNCTEDGVKTFTCTVCNATKTEIIPAQHVWGEYAYNNDASEDSAGTKTRECAICHTTETLPANGPNTATYQFTETVQSAPEGYSGTMESAGKTGRYVIFGDFPQTVAESGVTFNPHAEDNGYYVGSDGCYYEKVEVKEHSGSGRLMSDETTTIKTGDTVYFKVEPIIWRVLSEEYDWDGENGTGNAAFLLAENILTANVPWWEWTSSGGTTYHLNISEYSNPIYADNYKHSQIRAYLNGIVYDAADEENNTRWENKGFLQTAFTDKANKLIYTTVVDNNIPDDTPLTCENTEDKIFLISTYELSDEKYGFSENSDSIRLRKATDYAYANNLKYSESIEKSPWRLRTPHRRGSDNVSDREYFKTIDNGKLSVGGAQDLYYGIVPALTVPVSALPAQ